MQTEAPDEKKRPPRFLLAMPDDMRMALEKAAYVHGRTLTAEINLRLKSTLQAPPSYSARPAATVEHTNEKSLDGTLSGTDQAMLEIFRRLPVEKQLGLIALFK